MAVAGMVAASPASAQSSEVLDPDFTTLFPHVIAFPHHDSAVAPTNSLATPPMQATPSSRWFADQDYPQQALKDRREGEQRVRLTIDATGAVTDCAIEAASGYAPFDEAICALMRKRANFKPARDEAGEPTPGTIEMDIRFWLVPRIPPPPPQPKNP